MRIAKVGPEYFDREYWKEGTKSGYRDYGPHWVLHREIAEMLSRVFEPIDRRTRVLDYGGAFGFHAAYLSEITNCEPFLVDCSAYAIKNRHKKLKGNFGLFERAVCLDVGVSKLPWPSNFFHRIAAIEVMEHIYEPEVDFALSEMFRVLAVGGFGYSSIAVGEKRERDCLDRSHQTIHPMEWWRERFQGAGFRFRNDLKKKALETRVNGKLLAVKMRWQILCFEKEPPLS